MTRFSVYMLECIDKSIYVGHTDNMQQRLSQHVHAVFSNCHTAKRLPVKLIWQQEFASRDDAFRAERKIKKWTQNKKRALAANQWDIVSLLSKSG